MYNMQLHVLCLRHAAAVGGISNTRWLPWESTMMSLFCVEEDKSNTAG